MKNNLIIKIVVYLILIMLSFFLILATSFFLYTKKIEIKSVSIDNNFSYHLQKYPFRYQHRYRIVLCYNMYGCGWRDAYPIMHASKIYDINVNEDKLYISVPKKTENKDRLTKFAEKNNIVIEYRPRKPY